MKDFKTNQKPKSGELKNKPISQEEKKRREDAVNYARASVGLEGFVFSELDEADAKRFVDGDIDMDAYISLGFGRVRAIFEKTARDKNQ